MLSAMAFMVELLTHGAQESRLLHVVEEDSLFGVADVKADEVVVIRDGFLHEPKAMGHVYVIPMPEEGTDFEAELTDENRVASIPAGWSYERNIHTSAEVCGKLIIRHYLNPNDTFPSQPPFAAN